MSSSARKAAATNCDSSFVYVAPKWHVALIGYRINESNLGDGASFGADRLECNIGSST